MYDLIILGAGPAGLTASIYACRYKLKNLVLGATLGGAMTNAFEIENYPGYPKISGALLAQKMIEQVKALGGEIKNEEVLEIKKEKEIFRVKTSLSTYQAKAIILALGTQKRRLQVEGEAQFLGKGVSYCATCDAFFLKDKKVAVVGGGDAGATAALHLADLAKEVYLIVRENQMKAEPAWQEKIQKNPKIKVIYNCQITKIMGQEKVSSIELDKPYQGQKSLPVEGVFIEIGAVPAQELAQQLGLEVDSAGYLKVDQGGRTNLEKVYAAGDLTTGSNNLRQIITACAEGAIAASSAYFDLKK